MEDQNGLKETKMQGHNTLITVINTFGQII